MLLAGTYVLANDGGSWFGETTGFNSAELGVNTSTAILVGQDGYEGLTAYVLFNGNQDFGSEFSGVIFPSAMPEVLGPYAAE